MKAEFHSSEGRLATPGKKRPGSVGKRTRLQVYDGFTQAAIRKKVHNYFMLNKIPTVKKVMADVNADPELPNFGRTAMQNMLKDLNFVFHKRTRNSLLIERDDIVLWRRQYLRAIRRYRQDKRPIYYLDETWVNTGHTKMKVWQDKTVKSSKEAFLNGLSTGLKAPSGKCGRLIILHAGNENGFVPGAELVFAAKKSTGDYHEEMDGKRFEKWFTDQLLPNIQPHSIIVMDNAPYHSVKLEKIPTMASRKDAMQEWLTEKQITWDATMLKKELLELINREKEKYDKYRIDNIALLHGQTVLRLPPYHCEFNPIELVWSNVMCRICKICSG